MVWGLLDQLKIFSQSVVSDRIARDFNKSGVTRAVALDISKAFGRVCHVGLLHKLKSYGIPGQIFDLFLLFSVIDGFEWIWMENFHKNIQLMMYFLRASFLVFHFSCDTSMTFLTMLSVILLYMLMILLSVLSVIRHLICDSSLNWLLNLNLIYETLWNEVKSGFLISMLEKLNRFPLIGLTTMVLLMWK